MNKAEELDIELQRIEVFDAVPTVRLYASCSVDGGIIGLKDQKKDQALRLYQEREIETAFFIPASGSGSRMFHFLYEYLNSGEETDDVKRFFNEIRHFAFYESIPLTVRNKINATEQTSIAAYLVSRDGMGFGFKPKGLIPFHLINGKRITPFQEQVLQSSRVLKGRGTIHFTIQEEYQKEISVDIDGILTNEPLSPVEFSVQSSDSDAYCFDDDHKLVTEHDIAIRKPAGHGALLENLNRIKADYVLLKNIDNIQPEGESGSSEEYWKILIGYLTMFKDALMELSYSRSIDQLKELNKEYQFLSDNEVAMLDSTFFDHIVARPTRVCGVVRNEGKPGGGPFWIDDEGRVSKQIVEKSQISEDKDQQEILEGSTHFNPVFMAVSKTDVHGIPLDLNRFKDDSKYIRVAKSHKGKMIHFRELPGLWNGGMHDWNTIFLELPNEIFTPVKSALDLLSEPHIVK